MQVIHGQRNIGKNLNLNRDLNLSSNNIAKNCSNIQKHLRQNMLVGNSPIAIIGNRASI